jgi:hypothetical protein
MRSLLSGILRKIIFFLLLAGLVWWGLGSFFDGKFSHSEWFKSQPVTIDQTPLVVTNIRQIAELQTARMYCEMMVDSIPTSPVDLAWRSLSNTFMIPGLTEVLLPPGKKLVMVAKGNIIAGIDVSAIGDENITIKGDSVWVSLPAPKILDIITNPSDFEIFAEDGDWSNEAIQAVKQKARTKMEKEAHRQGLLTQAEGKAISLMQTFLLTSGYKYAKVEINAASR